MLGFIAAPLYAPEPGVFGSLTADGCSTLVFDPTSDDISPICFDSLFDPQTLHYAPTTYRYTDPYGTVYTMGADGTLKSIQDRTNNIVTFTATGITSQTTGQTVAVTRDDQGRITKIVTPSLLDAFNSHIEYDYSYDTGGNLNTVVRPQINGVPNNYTYTYDTSHRLLTTVDPLGHPERTSTYDDAGRLATDTDALHNVTKYAYDTTAHTTTTTYPDTGVTTQTFDDNGLLLSMTDQLGRTTKHHYDANRNEVTRTNALNEVTTYTYDTNGNQTSSKNALGETTTTLYNAFSEPLTTTNPIGNTTTIVYDANGLPTTFSDSMGPLATFTSSEHGMPISVTDAAESTVFLGYDDAGNLTSRTDRLGRTTGYTYDGLGRQLSKTTPRLGVWSYGYNDRNQRTLTQDPVHGVLGNRLFTYDENGNTAADRYQFAAPSTNYTYDALNHLTRELYADGGHVDYTRDFRGNVLTRSDEVGKTTAYQYDLAGQLVKTTNPDNTFTTQTYDDLGRLASKTDERNNTTTYGYQAGCDCQDRLTSITDPLLRTTSMTYDGMSRKTSMTDANNHTTSYVYDLRGHLIETDYADNTSTHDTYDDLGRRIASTDQMNKTTRYGYDQEGQLTSVTDPLNNVTQYGYDADGNLASVTDANNHTTTYTYDKKDQKTGRTLPLLMSETFDYDIPGNQTQHVDFRGKKTTVAYDSRNRLLSKTPDASLGEPTVTYGYNLNGTRSTMSDASGTTTYTYDSRARLLTKATPEGTLTYTYDPSGNVASIDSSNANGTSVAYAWDAANQLSTVTDNRLGGMTTAAYTATGRPESLSQPNGVGVTYGYDSLDRVMSMVWQKGTNPAFASFEYGYNPRGQRTSATDVTGREAAYGYDSASRLTSETITGDPGGQSGNGGLTYGIDPVGNRLSRTSTLAALGAQSFSYDANDELTSDAYDPNGNTTSSGGHTYAYDFENRLVSKDGGAVTLLYDGDGNRIAKTAGGVTTQYLVDDLNPTGYLQVMEEVSGGSVQVRYTYGNVLVSQTRTPSTTMTKSFYGYDAHGSIAFLTDATGTQTDTYTYDAWGNLVSHSGSMPNTRLFAGEEFDPDLGLINLRARHYQTTTGRFLTIDPLDKVRPTTIRSIRVTSPAITIANDSYVQSVVLASAEAVGAGQGPTAPLDLNRYLYANADPVRLGDPTGLEAEEEAELEGSFSTGTVRAAEKLGRNSGCEVEFLVKVLSCAARYGGNQMGFDICVASAARAYAVCRETGLPN